MHATGVTAGEKPGDGGREQLIMAGLVIMGLAVAILGGCEAAGPLTAVPSSSNWALFFGAVLSGGGGVLLPFGHLGVFARAGQKPDLSKTSDVAKTYHANRWWMRDGSGSVLIWDDHAQAWSPWVHGRDPGLPPGWS